MREPHAVRCAATRALHAAAPGLLTALCDALNSAERRAEEAEAQAAAMRALISEIREANIIAGEGAAGRIAQVKICDAALASDAGRALLDRLRAAEACIAEAETAQKMRAESADPDDETWRTREEYLRRVKAEAERDALRGDNARIQSELDALRAIIESGRTAT